MCDAECPQGCICHGHIADCQATGQKVIPMHIQRSVRLINLNKNEIEMLHNLFYPFLAKLFIAENFIQNIVPGTFEHLKNLLVLDLSYNRLTTLRQNTFIGLTSLLELSLIGNADISVVEPGAFSELKSLPELHLSGMHISILEDHTFDGLDTVKVIDMMCNKITMISDLAFTGLRSVTELDLKDNDIKRVSRASLEELSSLTYLQSDHFKLCCLATQVQRDNCLPPQDPISSCEDLMNNNILRTFIWILGTMALLGNIYVVAWRLSLDSLSIPDIIISNLAVSDFLMGLYMLIIAGVDLYYKGVFIEFSDLWREGRLCQLAGFCATFSSEASVMFLVILTVDRFINILFPFSSIKFTKSTTYYAIGIVWLLSFLVSVVPFIPLNYFGDNYYGRSGVCMALPITNDKPTGKYLIIHISYT